MNKLYICAFLIFIISSYIFPQPVKDPLFTVSLKNDLPVLRKSELILIPIAELKKTNASFDINDFHVRSGDKVLPFEVIENTNVCLPMHFDPSEEKKLRFYSGKTGFVPLQKRTQAYLGKKTGYELEKGYYTKGKFVSVNTETLPQAHFPHDALYQYEGPGWESERVAYRFYLDERNRTDIFGKKTPDLIVNKIGVNDLVSDSKESYTKMQDWGQDIFKVGTSLGIGSAAVMYNGILYTISKCKSIETTIKNNNLISSVETKYNGWQVGEDYYDAAVKYSISADSRLTEVNFTSSKAIQDFTTGLAKHPNTEFIISSKNISGNWDYIALWGKQALSGDDLGIFLFYSKDNNPRQHEDSLNYLVTFSKAAKNISYYFGACWVQEYNGIRDITAFKKYLDETRETLNNPIEITFDKSYSEKIADNFIKLYPDTIAYPNSAKSYRWNYEQGLMMYAFYRAWEKTSDDRYLNYVIKNMDHYINPDGSIKTLDTKEFNLDNITPGRMLITLYSLTGDSKYRIAADTIYSMLRNHPRTSEGGFWHKRIYPHQMWLDGLYMAEPFYLAYAQKFNHPEMYDDIYNQFFLIDKHLKDKKTGLYYHGWDESKTQKWADPVTGRSPNFWSRSIGWYFMALIDVLEYYPKDNPQYKKLSNTFQELASSILKYRDPKTLLWYQVTDKKDKEGNYIEASGSSMFIYGFAKGYNLGILKKKFFIKARSSFVSLKKILVKTDGQGKMYLTNVCSVSGLGGKPYRDGSFKYYISEPKRDNDFKGYGPFLLASLELEKRKGKSVALDYFFNNEVKNNKRYHYTFEDTAFSGFSELGDLFKTNGWVLKRSLNKPDQLYLKDCDLFIITDPDTKSETPEPKFITKEDITEITQWVKNGGVLLILANDSANCEFNNLNLLTEKFNIKFDGNSLNRVTGKNFSMGKVDELPDHPLFKGVSALYLKEISSITCGKNVESVLTASGNTVIAHSKYGKGHVIAVGDPWLYNEYIDNRKLPSEFDNLTAAKNLVTWLETLIPAK